MNDGVAFPREWLKFDLFVDYSSECRCGSVFVIQERVVNSLRGCRTLLYELFEGGIIDKQLVVPSEETLNDVVDQTPFIGDVDQRCRGDIALTRFESPLSGVLRKTQGPLEPSTT